MSRENHNGRRARTAAAAGRPRNRCRAPKRIPPRVRLSSRPTGSGPIGRLRGRATKTRGRGSACTIEWVGSRGQPFKSQRHGRGHRRRGGRGPPRRSRGRRPPECVATPTPSPVAVVPSSSPGPRSLRVAGPGQIERHRAPAVGEHGALRLPVRDARPHPGDRAGPAHGHAGEARDRGPARDGGHGRRPVRRPAAVGPVGRRRRVAGARRGRHPALHGVFQTGEPARVGPVRSSRLYFIAWASEWRSVYVHAGGSPQALALLASSKGQGSVRLQRRRVPLGRRRVPVADPHRGRAPQRVHGRQAPAAAGQAASGAAVTDQAGLELRRPRPARAAAGRRRLAVPYLANKVSYKYDRRSKHLPPLGHGREEADRCGHEDRIAPNNVDRHGGPLRAAQRRRHKKTGSRPR